MRMVKTMGFVQRSHDKTIDITQKSFGMVQYHEYRTVKVHGRERVLHANPRLYDVNPRIAFTIPCIHTYCLWPSMLEYSTPSVLQFPSMRKRKKEYGIMRLNKGSLRRDYWLLTVYDFSFEEPVKSSFGFIYHLLNLYRLFL